MIRYVLPLALLTLCACDPTIMNSSGAAYLSERRFNDAEIAQSARYEPDLRFPARIGVVRLVYNQITSLPDPERELLMKEMPAGLGTFVPISALDAKLARTGGRYTDKQLRSLAASRHLDYLLLISFDPGQNTSEALFVDVATGYPYASASHVRKGRGIRNFWGGPVRSKSRLNAATLELAHGLKPKLHDAARHLLASSRR